MDSYPALNEQRTGNGFERALMCALENVNAELAIVGLHVTLEPSAPGTGKPPATRYSLCCSGEAAPPGRHVAFVSIESRTVCATLDGRPGMSIERPAGDDGNGLIYDFLLGVVESLLAAGAMPGPSVRPV